MKTNKENSESQIASHFRIYQFDFSIPKSGLVARGKAPVRHFSAKPLQLDDNLQVFVVVDDIKVMLGHKMKSNCA